MIDDLEWLATRFGRACRDRGLIEAALTHRSAGGVDNERLEFLGDAVLSFAVAELLYREFPLAGEGELSRRRASLVSGETLADIAESLGVGERLRLGPGELRSGGFRRRSILADALEALIGAVHLDGGALASSAAVERLLRPRLAAQGDAPATKDPKTRLQEWLQSRSLPLARYTVATVTGEQHEPTFAVRCEIESASIAAEGIGSSRRRAEQVAAERALEALGEPRVAT
jgi:ribonuclease-3